MPKIRPMPDPAQLQDIEVRLRAVEGRTGVQVVAAGIERADLYHGLRWRAFSLGAAASGTTVALVGSWRPSLLPTPAPFFAVAASLGVGMVLALAATFSLSVARLFLEPLRAEAEIRQRAKAIFLERELFATSARTAVLLLACRFEREAVALADVGFRGRVTQEDWRGVEAAMTGRLRVGGVSAGLLAGLEAVERLLVARGFAQAAGASNELPDRPIVERGV